MRIPDMAHRLRIYIVRFTAASWKGKKPKVVYPWWEEDDEVGLGGEHMDYGPQEDTE